MLDPVIIRLYATFCNKTEAWAEATLSLHPHIYARWRKLMPVVDDVGEAIAESA